jgi:phosphoglycerate dehydrogenase-like enzyme
MAETGWSDLRVHIAHCRMAPKLVPVLGTAEGLHIGIADGAPVDDADVVIGYHFPPDSLAGLKRLRWLHLTGTGTDHLRATGLPDHVIVTTSAAVPVTAVAEYAVSGLLLLVKELPEVVTRDGAEWFSSRARLLSGSVVAVVGAGRIGRAVIRLLAAFGARTVAVTRTGDTPVPEADRTIGAHRLAAEAPALDHLVACLPGGAGTRGLVGADVVAALPAHATVVNVGRGETIDHPALHRALRDGRLHGAFLDVHEREPLPGDDPAWQVPRLIISPHRAFAFPGEPVEVARTFLTNLRDLRDGRAPRDLLVRHEERTFAP